MCTHGMINTLYTNYNIIVVLVAHLYIKANMVFVCVCVCHTAFCVLTLWQNRQQLGIGIRRQLGTQFLSVRPSVSPSVHPSFPPVTAHSPWGQHGRAGGQAGKDWAGGSSTSALCIGFTLVYNSSKVVVKCNYNATFEQIIITYYVRCVYITI